MIKVTSEMLLSSSVKYLCKITNFIFPPEKKIKSYIKKKKKLHHRVKLELEFNMFLPLLIVGQTYG